MSLEMHTRGHRLMTQRIPWETKQRVWSRMRIEGLRRIQKPFPTAADLHYPAIDMAITKQKPFWLGQITAGNRLASFVSMKEQADALSDAAADWFHFQVFQQSDFIDRIRVAVDTMLLRGRGVLKTTIDPFNDYALVHEAVDPIFILMPDVANGFGDADEWIHVQHWTVAKYLATPRFDQSPEVLKSIRGSDSTATMSVYVREKQLREGITHVSDADKIVIWEHWVRQGKKLIIHTYSPQAPDKDIRAPYECAYRDQKGKTSCPFVSFQAEVKDDGWYSPRGLAEKLAPIEAFCCKLWNSEADNITIRDQPVLTSEGDISNIANIRWGPLEVIPGNVKAVQMPPMPMDLQREMMFAREIGEQQVMMPDFGITNENDTSKARTATENERISALQSAGMNDNALMFRASLTQCYRHMWNLFCQFKERDFSFYAAGRIGQLPAEALHNAYLIMPDGAPDGWNRQKRMQVAVARMQAYAGNPNVSMEELTHEALMADDPRLALKVFLTTNQRAGDESYQEALNIICLSDGYPAPVLPGEDHATRLMVDLGWLHKQGASGAPVDPVARQRVQEHMALHFQYLLKTNPDAAKQLIQQIQAATMGGQQQPQPQSAPAL